jgi:hypothetical protein
LVNADIVNLSEGLRDRLLPVLEPFEAGWTTEWFKPESPTELPMLCVTTRPTGFADYTQIPTLWMFDLDFYLSIKNLEQSWRDMSTLTGRNGPIIAALEDPDPDDGLFDLTGLTISANLAKGGVLVKEKRNTYLTFAMAVQLSAD